MKDLVADGAADGLHERQTRPRQTSPHPWRPGQPNPCGSVHPESSRIFASPLVTKPTISRRTPLYEVPVPEHDAASPWRTSISVAAAEDAAGMPCVMQCTMQARMPRGLVKLATSAACWRPSSCSAPLPGMADAAGSAAPPWRVNQKRETPPLRESGN